MRLFVALDLPDEVGEAVREVIAALKPLHKGARWVRPEGMHVTLKFIGHVPDEKLQPIRGALANVHSHAAVEIAFRGVGFFPNERRPRVVWCGVEASENLALLAASTERALEPLGIVAEKRGYTPHLTLARFKDSSGSDKLVRAAAEWKSREFGTARETAFHLYQSLLKPSGAEYRKIATFPFVKESA
jgi:RNA 2',3'-cyclic 3'-phosphodiesterase